MENGSLGIRASEETGAWFRKLARRSADASGSPSAFQIALVVVIVWAATGPWMHFSDTWQLIINTVTNVATFVMVFLIQHTQNRDTTAIQLKLDELIKATKAARNAIIDLDSLTDQELK